MARIRLTPGQVPGMVKGNNKAALRATRSGLKRAAQRSKSLLAMSTPKVDTGQLRASWKVRKSMETGIASARGGGMAATVINDAPHAGIIEGGARPHKVSLEGFYALFLWAKRHGFSGARRKFQRGGRSRVQGPQQMRVIYGFPFADADVASAEVALGIVRKIQAHGQAPTWYVRNLMPALHQIANEEVAKRVAKSLKRKPKGAK